MKKEILISIPISVKGCDCINQAVILILLDWYILYRVLDFSIASLSDIDIKSFNGEVFHPIPKQECYL